MNQLFKGYVPTKEKKCLMKFKNASKNELLSYEKVTSLPEFAGILNDDVILVDIDDFEQSEILMEIVLDLQLDCRVYETTKGKHFLFLNDAENGVERGKNKATLACGLVQIDMKIGRNNSYSILKYGDKERKIIYDIADDEEYEELPKWLYPVRTNTTFTELGNGDGRNQALFNHILTLQSNNFSKDEAKDAIKILNGYVLQEPLEESELDVILRDEAFMKPIFFRKGQFLFDVFAKYMINNHHIKRINGQLHIYKNGIYVDGYGRIEAEMIKLISNLNRAKRGEVISIMELFVQDDSEVSPAQYIAFKNGIYNLETNQLEPFSPDRVITNKISFDYVEGVYSKLADDALNRIACHDPEIRSLLEEAIGYCFYRRNELRQCFILTGERENGKSTYLDMISTLLGSENISTLDLKELDDRFKTAELYGKLANVGDDISGDFIPNPAVFKKLVSGEPMNIERKGQQPFDFRNYSKLLFSANSIPRIKDKSGAVLSRLLIIPFDAKFPKTDPNYDPFLKYKLRESEHMEYLIQIGLAGLKRVLKNNHFTTSGKVKKSLEEYAEANNPILLFFKEDLKVENEPTKSVYMQYNEFCITNNFTPMSNIEFSKQVKRHYDFDVADKTIKGKKYRIFVKAEEKMEGQ